MMAQENIKERIAKLLSLGKNNPNEHEADAALKMAAQLMLQHGMTEEAFSESNIRFSLPCPSSKLWLKTLALAASRLYGVRVLVNPNDDTFRFVGRPSHIDSALDTFIWLRDQVEYLYKLYLPKGLSVSERSHHRKRFKDAMANRLYVRVLRIVDSLEQEAVPGTALTVVDHRKQLESEARDHLRAMDISTEKKQAVAKIDPTSMSAWLGAKMGNSVEINKKVKS